MRKYDEVPWYWYAALLVLAFFAGRYLLALGLVCTQPSARLDRRHQRRDYSTLVVVYRSAAPWWYVRCLDAPVMLRSHVVVAFIAPFSNLLFARMGNGIATNQLMKMVAAACNPGRPVANLYVSLYLLVAMYGVLMDILTVLDVEP